MDARRSPLRVSATGALRACLVAGLLASIPGGPGCAPDLQAGCPQGLTECGDACVVVASDPAHCGACGHDCLGGECLAGVCQPVVVSIGPVHAFDLVLDAASIYWTSQGATLASEGDVRRISRTGGGTAALIASNLFAPRGVAVDGDNVYWVNLEDDRVMMAPKAGGEPVVIATGQSGRDIAVDATYVYWTNTTGEVMKAPLDQSAAPAVIYAGPEGPDGIALDGERVYWANRLTGEVSTAPFDNPSGASVELFSGPAGPTDLVVDATHVYWSNHETGEVMKAPLTGDGSSATLIAQGQLDPFGLAVDATHLYWANYGDGVSGQVVMAPLQGGEAVVLVEGQPGPRRIAVDEAAIYWTNHDSGQLMKLAR